MQISICFISLFASCARLYQRRAAPTKGYTDGKPYRAEPSRNEPYSALLGLSELHFLPYWALLRLIGP